MFSNNLKILLLTRSSIQLYLDDNQPAKLEYSGAEVKDLEIVDAKKLEVSINELIDKSQITKANLVMVLADDLLFSKKILTIGNEAQQQELQTFLDEVPFDKNNISTITVENLGKKFAVAANSALFKQIENLFNAKNLKIKFIVPVTTFNITIKNNILSPDDIKNILSDNKKLNNSNFQNSHLSSDNGDNEIQQSDQASIRDRIFNKQYMMAALGIGLLLFASTLILYSFGILKNPLSQNDKKSQITQIVDDKVNEQEATSEADDNSYLDKNDIKVLVLNGSGIAGQASKVQALVEDLDYLVVDAGNATITGGESTTINYSKSVSPEQKNELEETLEETFENVISQDKIVNPDYDILITTGTEK